MLSYVVIHRSADKKLHDNKLNTAVDKLLVDFGVRNYDVAGRAVNTAMADTILSTVNRIDKITKNFAFIQKEDMAIPNIDSTGEVLPLYTVTCIE
jgi:hypothetical protein